MSYVVLLVYTVRGKVDVISPRLFAFVHKQMSIPVYLSQLQNSIYKFGVGAENIVGKLAETTMPEEVTVQGNDFNGSSQLLKSDSEGKISAENIKLSCGKWSWKTNYANLTNLVDNVLKYDTEELNNSPDTYELVNSGTITARIHIKKPGLYQALSGSYFGRLQGNMDFLVKLKRAETQSGVSALVLLLSDTKIAEAAGDHLVQGSTVFEVETPGFYEVNLFPTLNNPSPEFNFNTAPFITFIKLN
jgi:hypothetical protein